MQLGGRRLYRSCLGCEAGETVSRRGGGGLCLEHRQEEQGHTEATQHGQSRPQDPEPHRAFVFAKV